MRILHFYKTYYPDTMGGTEQVINQLARSSVSLGIRSEVLSLSSKSVQPTIEIDGHKVHRERLLFEIASTGFSFKAYSRFIKLAKEADLIHYHYPWPFMDLVHFAAKTGKPSVVTYHADIIKQKTLLKFYQPLRHRFLSSVDSIVATSPTYLETSPVLADYRDKTVVIPIGLDKSTYPIASKESLAKWSTLLNGQRFFLFVGMLRYYKGLHILLDALAGTNFPVVIVGTGPLESSLKAQMKKLKLEQVHFTGALPDEEKVALLELCYGVVFPSHLRAEAFGISLLEGAMYGKPMISTEIGTGTSFVNKDKETGLVIPPNNPARLREAMQTLWDNPLLAHQMGIEARKRFQENFTAAKMAASYAQLYQRLL